jgi:hypothetical protein
LLSSGMLDQGFSDSGSMIFCDRNVSTAVAWSGPHSGCAAAVGLVINGAARAAATAASIGRIT